AGTLPASLRALRPRVGAGPLTLRRYLVRLSLAEEGPAACLRLVGMASIAYHAPSRSVPFHVPVHVQRELALLVAAFVLFVGGLALGMALHGSHAARTPSLAPAQTQTAP